MYQLIHFFKDSFFLAELKARLLDPNEKIRVLAVQAICNCALEVPEKIKQAVLEEVGNRMRDKKVRCRSH